MSNYGVTKSAAPSTFVARIDLDCEQCESIGSPCWECIEDQREDWTIEQASKDDSAIVEAIYAAMEATDSQWREFTPGMTL